MTNHNNSEQENIYKAIFENSPEVILLMSKSGDIININKIVFNWLGYKPEEIIGKNFMEISFI